MGEEIIQSQELKLGYEESSELTRFIIGTGLELENSPFAIPWGEERKLGRIPGAKNLGRKTFLSVEARRLGVDRPNNATITIADEYPNGGRTFELSPTANDLWAECRIENDEPIKMIDHGQLILVMQEYLEDSSFLEQYMDKVSVPGIDIVETMARFLAHKARKKEATLEYAARGPLGTEDLTLTRESRLRIKRIGHKVFHWLNVSGVTLLGESLVNKQYSVKTESSTTDRRFAPRAHGQVSMSSENLSSSYLQQLVKADQADAEPFDTIKSAVNDLRITYQLKPY